MAGISFDVEMSKAQLDNIVRRIKKSIEGQAPVLAFAMVNELGATAAVDKFVNFTKSNQFVSEFGIPAIDAANMYDRLFKTFNTIGSLTEHSIIKKAANGDMLFKLVSENYLRDITEHLWAPTPESTSDAPPILVNAWDVYEYGIVGSDFTGGRIKNAYLTNVKSDAQKDYSRSDLSIMIRKKGSFFKFGTGAAPKIFAVRSTVLKNIAKIEKNALAIISRFGKVGSA